MFNGKNKAITFSFDDGTTQDIRLIEIFDKYGLKATFNINSGFFGQGGELCRNDRMVAHKKNAEKDIPLIYKNHEIAVHTLTHRNLTELCEADILYEVLEDYKNLSRIMGYDTVGMAYPCGGVNNDKRVADIIKNNTPIKYARTITSSYSFAPQTNLYQFNPTVYLLETDKMFELAHSFLSLNADSPQIFYIWGHSFEFDAYDLWDKFEDFCALVSRHDDIFYGTNSEILLG